MINRWLSPVRVFSKLTRNGFSKLGRKAEACAFVDACEMCDVCFASGIPSYMHGFVGLYGLCAAIHVVLHQPLDVWIVPDC